MPMPITTGNPRRFDMNSDKLAMNLANASDSLIRLNMMLTYRSETDGIVHKAMEGAER